VKKTRRWKKKAQENEEQMAYLFIELVTGIGFWLG
jgi:hypothetical protein